MEQLKTALASLVSPAFGVEANGRLEHTLLCLFDVQRAERCKAKRVISGREGAWVVSDAEAKVVEVRSGGSPTFALSLFSLSFPQASSSN